MKLLNTLFLIIVATLSSCGDTENLYSNAYCRLYLNNATHNDPTLAPAMTPYAGAFTTISTSGKQFTFSNNLGQNSASNITALDERYGYVLGMNNGIIVGYGNSTDGIFFAYDRECPNCFNPDALPVRSYKIFVNETGTGICSNCHRQYDLNNGGIVSKGDMGKKMTRYYATTTGPYGMLSVQ